MAEWAKAAEVQLELARWLTSDMGKSYMRGWVAAETRKEPAKGRMYGLLSAAEPQKLLSANSIWVEKDMSELIEVARDDFRVEPFLREDLLVHTGFVFFEKPLLLKDRNGMAVSYGAISWCPIRFTNKSLGEVGSEEELLQKVGPSGQGSEIISHDPEITEDQWGVALTIYSSALCLEDAFQRSLQNIRREYAAPELIPLHYTPVMFGDDLDEGYLLDENEQPTGAESWWKTIQVTFRLMQQHIVTRDDAPVPRATRRRAQRAGLSPINEVCVIRLRRARHKADKEGEGTGRKLTHRHFREGHWRWQYYPSLQIRRQIRIQPTIVGDESLPLVIKKRYYRWDR